MSSNVQPATPKIATRWLGASGQSARVALSSNRVYCVETMSRRKDAMTRSDVRLDIRVTAEERAKIKSMADAHNISMSDLIRSLVASEETRRAQAARIQAAMGRAKT